MDNNFKRQPNFMKLAQMQAGMGGMANAHAIIQAGTDDSDVDAAYADTFDFEDDGYTVYTFIPDGDATFSEMEEGGQSVNEERLAYTYGDRIPVPGRFTRLVVAQGTVNIYKTKL